MPAAAGKGKFKELGPDAKGGVRLAFTLEDVVAHAKEMLGHTLVTKQTGPAGKVVNRLYIEDGADIERELYLSILVDRTVGRPAFVSSPQKAAWTSRPWPRKPRTRSSPCRSIRTPA